MLTTLERYILESISKKNNTIIQIHLDTDLPPKKIENCILNLQKAGWCFIQGKEIKLNLEKIKDQKPSSLQKAAELSMIVKNGIKNSINKNSTNQFKFEKVYLTEDDEKIFNSLLYNLEHFLKKIQKKKGSTAKEKIIFWGENTYKNIINDLYQLNNSNSIA